MTTDTLDAMDLVVTLMHRGDLDGARTACIAALGLRGLDDGDIAFFETKFDIIEAKLAETAEGVAP